MKVVILAGGLPSSIADESEGIPKPMVEIGGRPIIWHIMRHFASYGFNEFIICAGYKVNMIKDYFYDFYCYQSDLTIDLRNNQITLHNNISEDWKVTVVDTGLSANTGSRVRQIRQYVGEEEFLVTYGDCITDIDVKDLLQTFHENDKIATLALARPAGRNTIVAVDESGLYCGTDIKVNAETYNSWVNANIFAFDKRVFDYLSGDEGIEKQLLKLMSREGQVATYIHKGFWMPVETVRDRIELETMWAAHTEQWKARY